MHLSLVSGATRVKGIEHIDHRSNLQFAHNPEFNEIGEGDIRGYGARGSYCEDGLSQQPGDQKRGKN